MKTTPKSDATVVKGADVVEAWIVGDVKKPRPVGTQRAYRRAVRFWLDFLAASNGGLPDDTSLIWQVTASTARAWREELLRSKRRKPATVNQLLSSVTSFYKYAITRGLAPTEFTENPFYKHALRLRVHAYEGARILTTAEYRQLMNYLNGLTDVKSHLRAHALIRILLHTGWRAREVLVMHAGDLKPAVAGDGGMRYRSEMSDGTSFIDHLPADCVALMEAYLEKAGRPLETLADDEYIWSSVRQVNMAGLGIRHDMEDAIQQSSLLRMVRTYLRDAGIDKYETLTLRDLRHTHAAILYEGGASLEKIRKRMRYERIQSAERFVKLVLSAGEVDDVSEYFRALRKLPAEQEDEAPKRKHRTGKESK